MDYEATRRVLLRKLVSTTGIAAVIGSRLAVPAAANELPEAEFTWSPEFPEPDQEVTFDAGASSDPDGTIESFEWDGDDYLSGYSETTTHTYDYDGTYDVTLEVTDDEGGTDTVTKSVTVINSAPEADFSIAPRHPEPDEEVTFDASKSSDPDGSIEEFEWSGDDYVTGNSETTTHTYYDEGDYDVTLEVTDNGGKTDTATKTVAVGNEPPDPQFSYTPSDPKVGESISFVSTESSDPDGSVQAYQWYVNGESEEDISYMKHSFEEPGSHEVTLEVTDDDGRSSSLTKTVEVTEETATPTSTRTSTPTETSTTSSTSTATRTPTSTPGPTATPSPISETTSTPTATRSNKPVTRSTTRPPDASGDTSGSEGNGFQQSLLLGGSAVGSVLLGTVAWWYRTSNADESAPDGTIADRRSNAADAEAAGDAARDQGDYEAAVANYDEAITEYRTVLERLSTETDRHEEIAAALEDVRQKRQAVRNRNPERGELVDTLVGAESHLQTAIAAHARQNPTVARLRYRQAQDAYESALDTIDGADTSLLDPPVTVDPEPTTQPPDDLTRLPGVTDAIADELAGGGPRSLQDLAETDQQRLDELAAHDRGAEDFVERLRALRWWHRGEPITFPNREVVERRRDRAAEGYRSHR